MTQRLRERKNETKFEKHHNENGVCCIDAIPTKGGAIEGKLKNEVKRKKKSRTYTHTHT